MKRKYIFILSLFLFASMMIFGSSCKAKEGCDSAERYAVKTDKDGNMSTKRGKSNLWSGKQRKKMGK